MDFEGIGLVVEVERILGKIRESLLWEYLFMIWSEGYLKLVFIYCWDGY